MLGCKPFTHGGVLACVMAASVVSAQDPPLRTLSRVDLEYAEPFSCVSGVRELSDGRLVVADVKEKTVQLIDLRRGTATRIGQEGQGPGEWSTPMGLYSLPGDTTLLLDPQNQRFLTILPNGSVGKSFTIDLGGGPRGNIIATRPQGIDGIGRLYYQGSTMRFTDGAPPTPLDSAPIFRYDRRTAKVDTITWIRLPKSDVQSSGTAGNFTVRLNGPNPLTPQPTWAVAPDGRIAVVHGDPYQVEWFSTAKTRNPGPVTSYPRRAVSEADKTGLQSPDCSVMISFGGGGGGGGRGDGGAARVETRAVMTAGGPGRGGPPRTDWPAVMPPFATNRFGPARVAPNGELWVPRSRVATDASTYDVFDAGGKLASRVVMPKGTRVVGFGAGTVYAFRMDEDDLVYLQRYRLDSAR